MSLGVRQEVCAVAARVFRIDNKSVLPGLTLVSDGFIFLIGLSSTRISSGSGVLMLDPVYARRKYVSAFHESLLLSLRTNVK